MLLWTAGRSVEIPSPELADMAAMEKPLVDEINKRTAAVKAMPLSAAAWGNLAVTFDVHGLHAEAGDCYRRAMSLDSADFRWPYYLALSAESEDPLTRIRLLRTAASSKSDYAPIHVHLGDALLTGDRLEEAQRSYESALAIDPRLSHAHLGLGRIHRVGIRCRYRG